MKLVWAPGAWEDYVGWQEDEATLRRINMLIKECLRTPFQGVGKPEPLKNALKGFWSRRINQEDRLIYRVTGAGDDRTLEIVQCRRHY